MNRILDFFRKNTLLKILSLAFAFVLWIFVKQGQPILSVQHEVPVRLATPKSLILVSDFIPELKATISGPRSVVGNIKKDDLFYEVDASGFEKGEFPVKFIGSQIKGLPPGVTVSDMIPTQVSIVLAERGSRTNIPVNIVVKGNPAEGYEIGEKTVDPPLVDVSGAVEELRLLKHVSTVSIDITGRSKTLKTSVGLDLEGQHIDPVDVKYVDVTIEINEKTITKIFPKVPIKVVGTELSWKVSPMSMDINIQMQENKLRNITASDIQLIIDADGLEAGKYQIRPKIHVSNSPYLVFQLPKVTVELKGSGKTK